MEVTATRRRRLRAALPAGAVAVAILLTACGDRTTIINSASTARSETTTTATVTEQSGGSMGDQTADGQGTSSSMVPDSGTYTGQAVQAGRRASTNKTYPVTMSFSSGGSSVDYPTLGCHGTLRPDGFRGSRRLYIESITRGHCDSGGTWAIQRQGSRQLMADWTLGSQDYGVAVTLTR